jgi:hypothetical protein
MAGAVCGTLVFMVALPLALSSPFPTPKQGEWVLQTSSFDVGSPMPATPWLPPPMEPLPIEPPLVTASLGTPRAAPEPVPFAERWNGTAPVAATTVRKEAPPIMVPTVATRLVPTNSVLEVAPPKRRDIGSIDPVEQYLWEVYQRKPVKTDSSGDFTWKDPAAAKKRGISLQSYVIGGMDPDFREQLYHAGHAMDATGIHWSMLSAFRDDYRQALAAGYKAHGGNSQHGGSNATGGYGHGRAIDITTADGEPAVVWHWIDSHGEKFGLRRPMPGADPAHIQPRPTFHDLAHQLRDARTRLANEMNGTEPAAAKTKVAVRTDEASDGHRARR